MMSCIAAIVLHHKKRSISGVIVLDGRSRFSYGRLMQFYRRYFHPHRSKSNLCLFALLILISVLHVDASDKAYSFKPIEQFERDYSPPAKFMEEPHWYKVSLAYVELPVKPPGKAFMLEDLPKEFDEQAAFDQFQMMGGNRHHFSNYTLVSRNPLGDKLEVPFALGEITYFAVLNDTKNKGIKLSFYHYRNDNVDWLLKESEKDSSYELREMEVEQQHRVPSGRWLLVSSGKYRRETIEKSERKTNTIHRYLVMRVIRMGKR